MNANTFALRLKEQGIELNEHQREQFDVYFKSLTEWNEKINLTALTEESDVFEKHFFDSIAAAFYHDFTKPIDLCDVGAGAGFPSIPLKICFPHIKVTIVDSLKKRIHFLNHLAAQLELQDIAFYHERAENFGKNKKFREKFDVVSARAVARMSILAELCLPLVKKNGVFLAMKGAQVTVELKDAEAAIELLGGNIRKTHTFSLPEEKSERSIVVIDKDRKTPKKYPRKAGTPNKDPIE